MVPKKNDILFLPANDFKIDNTITDFKSKENKLPEYTLTEEVKLDR
jgi:hypothetical protein